MRTGDVGEPAGHEGGGGYHVSNTTPQHLIEFFHHLTAPFNWTLSILTVLVNIIFRLFF